MDYWYNFFMYSIPFWCILAIISFFVERYTRKIDKLVKIHRGVDNLNENLWDSGVWVVFVAPIFFLLVNRHTSTPIERIAYISAFFAFFVILRLYQAQQKKKELENE
ncbi:MAG: hypothetical protein O0V67_02125 [Methanocorpusculum sp.]|nr:hypothetical protein [Methanocorpusculum sp.]